jgi:hypothetical protein
MRELGSLGEEEMVAAFLQSELASSRFGSQIAALLQQDGRTTDIIQHPNVDDAEQNRYRRYVLDAYRGFDARTGLFDGFPRDVRWKRVLLTPEELRQVRYINYTYWIELSCGTRRPADAAARIAAGSAAFGVSNAPVWAVADALERGEPVPSPILVGSGQEGDVVILEGHVRLTAYFLRPQTIPPAMEAIVGVSPALCHWALY